MLTRRDWIRLGIGVPTSLAAMPGLAFASKEFWEAKPSSEWSSAEVERMITKSPWAKEVIISTGGRGGSGYPNGGNRRGGMGGGGIGFPGGGIGFPGGGGLGYPGGGRYPNGGGYPGGGSPNGGNYPNDGPRTYHATLRWESAAPIQEALRIGVDDKPNPDFAKYYVLNLIGDLPDPSDRSRGYDEDRGPSTTTCNNCNDDDDRSRDGQDDEARAKRRIAMFKENTKLERKDGFLKLEKVEEGSRFGSSSPGTAFYFSRLDNITVEDKLISFYTKIGRAEVRAKFTLKDMMYQGKLAV